MGGEHDQSWNMTRAYCISFEVFVVMIVPVVVFWAVTHVVLKVDTDILLGSISS
jgi:hypothetical protein